MIRTAACVTISAALFAIFASSACSSTSTNDDNKGGTGAVIGGSGGAASGSGGASNTTAGTRSDGGTAGSGTAGTGGGGLCAGKPLMCVDAMTAKGCDPQTGMDITANCAEEFAKDGLISNGCTMEATGAGCTIDGGSNETCWLGANGIAVCANLTDDQMLAAYSNCFHDTNDARPLLTCISDFVDEVAKTVDCAAAEAACADDGAGGEGPIGAGGAPDGAGGAQ